MVIVIYPEDLPKAFKGDKKNPKSETLFEDIKELLPEDIVLYKYGNKTIVLKSAESI
jgi:hypothetical protein